MPTLACAMVGICGCGFSCPFSMMRNLRFDEVKGPKNLGRHQGPTALGDRPSPMSAGPARPTQSVFGVPTHGTREGNSTNGQRSRPLPSSRAFPLSKGVPEGRGIKVPRSPMLLGFTPVVASRHREARSDPFMPDLCKICFK